MSKAWTKVKSWLSWAWANAYKLQPPTQVYLIELDRAIAATRKVFPTAWSHKDPISGAYGIWWLGENGEPKRLALAPNYNSAWHASAAVAKHYEELLPAIQEVGTTIVNRHVSSMPNVFPVNKWAPAFSARIFSEAAADRVGVLVVFQSFQELEKHVRVYAGNLNLTPDQLGIAGRNGGSIDLSTCSTVLPKDWLQFCMFWFERVKA